MKKKKSYVIGVDLGGTKMLTALLNRNFEVVSEQKIRMETDKGSKYFLKLFANSVHEVLDEAKVGLEKVAALGIGSPGLIQSEEALVLFCPNISFLKNFSFRKNLASWFDMPITVENDANAGLYGEQQFGAAQGINHLVGVFLGTGIGGALMLDGKIYRGAHGGAGEIGHMVVDTMGPICGCGKQGCLEALAGRVAIASEAAALGLKQKAPKLYKMVGTEVSRIKSRALAKAIKAGDKTIEQLISYKAKLIGLSLSCIVNLLNPEMIVLGGGLVEAMPELIVRQVKKSVREHAMPGFMKEMKIVSARLGDHAIVKGAAKLAWDSAMQKADKRR